MWFSNESKFSYFRNKIAVLSRDRVIRGVLKYSPGVMVWGAFSICGRTELVYVNGTVDQHSYQNILNEYLLEEMRALYLDGCSFQQKNALPHKAKTTMNFFKNQVF